MYNLLRLIEFSGAVDEKTQDELVEKLRSAAKALPSVEDVVAARTISSDMNAGDAILRIAFADRVGLDRALASDEWRTRIAPLFDGGGLTTTEDVIFPDENVGGKRLQSGLYRVALFCANQSPTPERIARFSDETAKMSCYVRSLRRWGLARPSQMRGARPWTVVWEQEYDDLDGLNGAYAMHPCHWAQVDRWFDPEYPEYLVDTYLCHSYCTFERA